ncbi:MAG TPA: aromatic-ring-hydroxylating dioxygenase subunit beta [Ramlibacter sp.]|uniref:aromatic-ring-hydroxylating dioxygenase subunit beta n=1 Tax=Ramlibacter sp. TaxID=1917967 RepID=UPI002B9D1458|nr:aromatic-ring-hydroxylating dioxygenase subunit beta [Ramlibacter sp.]HVZ46488.1 aromatic-ring-hydroxylating dioxygenase subunit beta [Ramlibacter sp.]
MTEDARAETGVGAELFHEVEQFLFREARLADESRYREWEALVEDDMIYWIPLGEGDFDPSKDLSITYDNRARLANRIKQLDTGNRLSQKPASAMRRMISNIEVAQTSQGDLHVFSNFVLYELAKQSGRGLEVWPGRAEHRLRRRQDGSLAMFFKKAMLVTGSGPVRSMAFIL